MNMSKNNMKYLKVFEQSTIYYLVIKTQKDEPKWANSVDLFRTLESAKNFVLNGVNENLMESDSNMFEDGELTNAGALEDKENETSVFIDFEKALDWFNEHYNNMSYEIQEIPLDDFVDVEDRVKKIRTQNRFDL